MAITITDSPNHFCPVNNEVLWKLTTDDLGTAPLRIDMGMYLAESGGTPLQAIDDIKYIPYEVNQIVPKDFQALARTQVRTTFPTESATVQNDSTIIKQVKLVYGSITLNTDTGDSTVDVNASSTPIYLINAAANIRNKALFGDASGFVSPRTGLLLSERPDGWKLLHGSRDYLWFLGTGYIQVKYYRGTTQIGSTHTFSMTGANTVKYVCLDYLLYGVTDKPTHAYVIVNDGTEEAGKRYKIEYFQCSEQDDYLGILFMEPLGGRSMFATGIGEKINGQKTFTPIEVYTDPTQTEHITGGRSFINPRLHEVIEFKTEVLTWPGYRNWIKNFITSSEYHAQIGYSTNAYWAKFILDQSTVQIEERGKLCIVQFRGELSEIFKGQYSAI